MANAVVVAVAHEALTLLLAHPVGLRTLTWMPIGNVHVGHDRTVTELPFATGLDAAARRGSTRTETSGITGSQCLAVSPSATHAGIGQPVAVLRRRFLPALPALFVRAIEARVVDCSVTREPAATFRQSPGPRALWPDPRTGVPGILVAGAWTDTRRPPTMEGTVRSGASGARAVLTSLEPPPHPRGDRRVTLTLPSTLARARALVAPALRCAVERLQPCTASIAGYHFGWLDADGRPVASNGGKALRPTLTLLGAQAVGGMPEDAVPAAVAVELVHNFALLHDDVMDADHERRHRPTAWTVFGVGPAVLAGDALLALAQQLLVESPSPRRIQALRLLNEATSAMIAGQGQDLAFERRDDVTIEEYVTMSGAKTGALLSASTAIGAVLSGAPEPAVDRLAAFGRHLGFAFQAVDDLLGIWGQPEVTGKPRFNDLRQRKKSLPVVAALRSGTVSAAQLGALMRRPGALGEDELGLAANLVADANGRAWAEAEAARQRDLALTQLDHPALDPVAGGELADLAFFVAEREF